MLLFSLEGEKYMHGLINLLIALVAAGITLAVLRSLAKSLEDGWRIAIAVIIGIIVFFQDIAQYILTNQ